jgi:hypothetical protein
LTVYQNPVSISAYEDKNDWINRGVLFFGDCSVPRRRSADGHLEA